MFAMDLPPDVPAQTAPVVIAMASQPKKDATKIDHTIGICHLIENPAGSPSAVNSLSPVTAVKIYLWNLEHRAIDKADLKDAKVSLLQSPKHGVLEFFEGTQSAGYLPSSIDYRGPDQATVLVEIGDRKVKVRYFFNVMQSTPPVRKDTILMRTRSCARRVKAGYGKSLLTPTTRVGDFLLSNSHSRWRIQFLVFKQKLYSPIYLAMP